MGCGFNGESPLPSASNEEIIATLCTPGPARWNAEEATRKFALANENPENLSFAETDRLLSGQDHLPVGEVCQIRNDLLHFTINWPGKGMQTPLALKQHDIPYPVPRG